MERRASLGLPPSHNSGPAQRDTYRTPVPTSTVLTPRTSSRALGRGGLLFGSQETLCPSYLTTYDRNVGGTRSLRAPSLPRDPDTPHLDLSLVYSHPRPSEDLRGRRRCVSEDREARVVGVGWRGTGGRSNSRTGSRVNLAEDVFRFLPPESLNQIEPPKLVIRKSPGQTLGDKLDAEDNNDDKESREVTNTYGADQRRKKKSSSGCNSLEDKSRREVMVCDLLRKLERILELLQRLQVTAEALLTRQTESEDFQKQMKKETEGYDLQRGVYRILDAIEGDRRELARLQRKTVEMRKRQLNGIALDGEEDELKSLILGAMDLEKKLIKAIEEIDRLAAKTEKLIDRQQKMDEQRRQKMLDEARKNEALQLLIQDLDSLDKLLKDLTEVRKVYTKAEGVHRKIQMLDIQTDGDEIDTDEMVLDSIRVDTQSATDDILKTREDIQKVQDAVIIELDTSIDVVTEAQVLQERIELTRKVVGKLSNEVTDFLHDQNERYLKLMKKRAMEEELRKKQMEAERAERERLEDERREKERRQRELEEEEQRRNELERQRMEADEKERIRLLQEQENQRKRLEEVDRKRLADEKMLQLQKMLDEEAEKNYQKQREEILCILEGDTVEIERLKDEVLILVDKQKKIGHIRRKRRTLFTIPEEDEIEEETELKNLSERTTLLFNALLGSENEIKKLKQDLENHPPSVVLNEVRDLEKFLSVGSENLNEILNDTDRCHNKHLKRLEEGLRLKEEEEKEKNQVLKDTENISKLKCDADQFKQKHSKLKKEVESFKADNAEEDKSRVSDLEELNKQNRDLNCLENDIFQTSQEFEAWKNFTWPEAMETEMNKFGMVGSLSMPCFPQFLITNPEIREKLNARKEQLRLLRERLQRETQRMAEICAALEDMERRRKEAELRRIAEQALEWTKDYVPSGPAEFGAMPVFRPDFTMDREESRALAASRKASRIQSRESSVVPVEEIGVLRGYEEVLQGYGARSRNQSLDRGRTALHDTSHIRSKRQSMIMENEMRNRLTDAIEESKDMLVIRNANSLDHLMAGEVEKRPELSSPAQVESTSLLGQDDESLWDSSKAGEAKSRGRRRQVNVLPSAVVREPGLDSEKKPPAAPRREKTKRE